MTTVRGSIKKLTDRHYGFIIAEGDDPRRDPPHFFHGTQPLGVLFHQLKPGQRVEFQSCTSPKGLVAKNVRPIE